MPILQSQGVKCGTGTPLYVPADVVVIDVSNNVSFPENVTVDKDLIVDGSANVVGNITAAGTIAAETSYYQGTATSDSYAVVDTDGVGNSRLQQVARASGNGQAYHDIVTLKPGDTHTFRRLIAIQGDCYLQNETPAGVQQQMYWDAAGTEMLFDFGATNAMRLNTSGTKSPAFVSVNLQNPNIATNAATTIFSIPATSLPLGKAAQAVINLYFFDGGLTQSNFVTYVVNICRDGASTINGYAENQATADAALLAQTGQAWTLSIAGAAPQLDVIINTLAAPAPTGGWYCNYNYTILGGQ